MFSERLNELMDAVGASVADLALTMNCDRSHVSRFKSGKRTPRPNGKGVMGLARGLYVYADENSALPALFETVTGGRSLPQDEAVRAVAGWLFGGPGSSGSADPAREDHPYRAFGSRFNSVMELSQITNNRLGKLINLDPSYISRFRGGLRSPRSNPGVSDDICSVLLNHIREQNKLRQLGLLMKTDLTQIGDPDEVQGLFKAWLFDAEGDEFSPVVEKLIEKIETFVPPAIKDVAAAASSAVEEMNVYYGNDGLRSAVLRFLSVAAESGVRQILLYSDHDMDWLTGSPDFMRAWSAAMFNCVKRGVLVKIIHNIDRDLGEMVDAINGWMPLYMSGMIESFYCKRQRNKRFDNTLFVCPGVCCIEGTNAVGTPNGLDKYRFDTDPALLSAHKANYDALLENSRQLVRIYSNSDNDRLSLMGKEGMNVLGTTIPLASMPHETLLRILDRNGVTGKAREDAVDAWRFRRDLLMDYLEKGYVHEFVPTADDEAIFSESVPVAFPDLDLTYTPSEYSSHVREVISLLDRYPSYRFCLLPDAPFSNTQIVVTDNVVAVTRLEAPRITFLISHPLTCQAFSAYAARIRDRYRMDRISAKTALERYL